jgi:hypothetical protein
VVDGRLVRRASKTASTGLQRLEGEKIKSQDPLGPELQGAGVTRPSIPSHFIDKITRIDQKQCNYYSDPTYIIL